MRQSRWLSPPLAVGSGVGDGTSLHQHRHQTSRGLEACPVLTPPDTRRPAGPRAAGRSRRARLRLGVGTARLGHHARHHRSPADPTARARPEPLPSTPAAPATPASKAGRGLIAASTVLAWLAVVLFLGSAPVPRRPGQQPARPALRRPGAVPAPRDPGRTAPGHPGQPGPRARPEAAPARLRPPLQCPRGQPRRRLRCSAPASRSPGSWRWSWGSWVTARHAGATCRRGRMPTPRRSRGEVARARWVGPRAPGGPCTGWRSAPRRRCAGVDDGAAAHVEGDVTAAPVEDHVARLDLREGHDRALALEGVGVTTDADAGLGIGPHDEARAVEGAGPGGAPHVGGAELGLGCGDGDAGRRRRRRDGAGGLRGVAGVPVVPVGVGCVGVGSGAGTAAGVAGWLAAAAARASAASWAWAAAKAFCSAAFWAAACCSATSWASLPSSWLLMAVSWLSACTTLSFLASASATTWAASLWALWSLPTCSADRPAGRPGGRRSAAGSSPLRRRRSPGAGRRRCWCRRGAAAGHPHRHPRCRRHGRRWRAGRACGPRRAGPRRPWTGRRGSRRRAGTCGTGPLPRRSCRR